MRQLRTHGLPPDLDNRPSVATCMSSRLPEVPRMVNSVSFVEQWHRSSVYVCVCACLCVCVMCVCVRSLATCWLTGVRESGLTRMQYARYRRYAVHTHTHTHTHTQLKYPCTRSHVRIVSNTAHPLHAIASSSMERQFTSGCCWLALHWIPLHACIRTRL